MFSGNGHEYITFGWIATIILALIAGSIYHSQYTRIQQSSEYADKCAAQYHDRLSGLNASPSEKKTSDSNQKYEGQPDWCDLAAQHSMAESTRGLHWAAWATVLFTGVGAFLIWQTLLTTQQTVRETRRIGEAQTRAYVIVSDVDGERVENDNVLEVKAQIENCGQTPAKNLRVVGDIFCDIYPSERDFESLFLECDAIINVKQVLGAKSNIPFHFRIEGSLSNYLALISKGTHAIYLYGSITYQDIFGEAHKTNFSFVSSSKVNDIGNEFYAYEDWNDTT